MAVGPAARRHSRGPLSRQCVFPRRQAVGIDRLLFRLHRHAGLRRRHLSQRLVLRAGSFLQCNQGPRAARELRQDAAAVAGGMGEAAAARARRRAALPAHAAGRLARRAAGRAGAAQGPDRISAQAPLPPESRQRRRLRGGRTVTSIRPHVVVHTDGACSGNPGPGGWGAILSFGDHEKELKGGEADTTNNRMELMAAIAALEALKKPCRVDLHTDSQYLRNGIMSYINKWKQNGWRTADKKPVKNIDLWQRLDAALKAHQVRWHWVKGHAGHDENERADQLARDGVAMARLKQTLKD